MKLGKEIILGVAALFAVGIIGCSSGGGNSSSTNNNGTDTTGTGGTGGNTVTTSKITIGAMTKGSVVLNGVHFDDSAAVITADDVSKTAAFLADGMTVKVKGTVSADGVTGIAENIEVVDEARGAVAAIGTDTLTVNGQTVLVDGGTVLAPASVTSIADLAKDNNIEVYGVRDDAGVIHATRVEKLAVAGDIGVRGAVSGKNGTTFNISGFPITSDASTTMVPSGVTFANGDIVDVRLNGNVATQITVERLDHPEFEALEGRELSVQGIISGYTLSTTAFKVGTQQVLLDADARIDGGVLADLIDGLKVEAEGHTATGGVLNAGKVTIKDNVRIEASATANGSASVLGKTVTITSGTRLDNLASGGSITANDGLRIRGFVNRDGSTITATRVTKLSNPVDDDKMIIQGPVKDINAAAHTLTIMGIAVSAGSATARPNDDSGTSSLEMTLDSFFSSVTADKTIVKAKGTFSSGTLSASEIEIE